LDPILQDRLFQQISIDGWNKWLINKTPFLQFIGTKGRAVPFEDKTFYYQFEEITERLDGIFHFVHEINYRKKGDYVKRWSPRAIAFYGALWLEQASMNLIIEKELNYQKRGKKLYTAEKLQDDEKIEKQVIDRTILQVSRHIQNEVRFELVKYFKLWSDILEYQMSIELSKEELSKYEYNLSLPLMLELGAYDPNVMGLIRMGVARSVAIEAATYLPMVVEGSVIDEVLKESVFSKLSVISQRHLLSLGFKPNIKP
jgi:hypothetical protein